MRTTLQLDDDLVVRAKIQATHTGRTLSQVIEDALRRSLAPAPPDARGPVSIPTAPGSLRSGVSLDDNAGLADLMDEP